MDPQAVARRMHRIFDVSVILKGINGLLEVLAGLLLSVLSPAQMGRIAYFLTRKELAEDPRDIISNLLVHTAVGVTSHGKLVSIVFLLSHGLIKLFLVWQLLRGRLWAYPLTIAVLLCFIAVQILEIGRHHSPLLIAVTILDAVIVVLAWYEYDHRKKSPK